MPKKKQMETIRDEKEALKKGAGNWARVFSCSVSCQLKISVDHDTFYILLPFLVFKRASATFSPIYFRGEEDEAVWRCHWGQFPMSLNRD